MVHITPETVQRFKKVFKKEYGVDYTDQEAWEATHNLLGVFEWLLKQDRKQHPENYKQMKNIIYLDSITPEIKEAIMFFPLIKETDDPVDILSNGSYIVVAKDVSSDKIVGYLLLRPAIDNLPSEIHYVEVLSDYQRMKIGKSLLEKAFVFLRNKGEKELCANSLTESVKFFEKMGFYKKNSIMYYDL